MIVRTGAIAILLSAAASTGRPASPVGSAAASQPRGGTIGLRKRVHVNTLIAEPGTMEFEWGGAFAVGGGFTLPAAIKYTPEGRHAYWGRTEFSASFDS